MSRLNNLLLGDNNVYRTTYNLSKSHYNVLQLLGTNLVLSKDNIAKVNAETLEYYNSGFAKETGTISQPTSLSEEYLILIKLMFSEEFRQEKTVVSMKDISLNDVIPDFSLFALYTLLISFKNIRVAVWEDFRTGEFAITSLYSIIYKTSNDVFSKSDSINPFPFDKWKRIAGNIVWNVKERWGFIDDLE